MLPAPRAIHSKRHMTQICGPAPIVNRSRSDGAGLPSSENPFNNALSIVSPIQRAALKQGTTIETLLLDIETPMGAHSLARLNQMGRAGPIDFPEWRAQRWNSGRAVLTHA